MNNQIIHYSKYYQMVHFINTPVRHPYPSSAGSTELSAFPGHSCITPTSTEALITLKGSPPPHVSLASLTHYWNFQVPSQDLPARESRKQQRDERFTVTPCRTCTAQAGKLWAVTALVSTLDDTDVNELSMYNLLKECQSALMHHSEMYHPSVLNNKYSSSFWSCEAAETENAAEYFCRLCCKYLCSSKQRRRINELRINSHGGK